MDHAIIYRTPVSTATDRGISPPFCEKQRKVAKIAVHQLNFAREHGQCHYHHESFFEPRAANLLPPQKAAFGAIKKRFHHKLFYIMNAARLNFSSFIVILQF
jgi:hypothetical protein